MSEFSFKVPAPTRDYNHLGNFNRKLKRATKKSIRASVPLIANGGPARHNFYRG